MIDGERVAGAEEFAGALIPVYPAAQGLTSWAIARVRPAWSWTLLDPTPTRCPRSCARGTGWSGWRTALHGIHRPRDHGDAGRARKRLKFDEAFAAAGRAGPAAAGRGRAGPPRRGRRVAGGLLADFDARLPFDAHRGPARRWARRSRRSWPATHPMHRLLQGEVGSGKTVVALRAMLQVVDAGGQAALLAPTEVLARSTTARSPAMLGDLAQAGGWRGRARHPGRPADRLAGRRRRAARRCSTRPRARPASSSAPTRCCRSASSSPTSGWSWSTSSTGSASSSATRCARRPSGGRPHVLVMTATPIPRTVAMTVFGDLEVSALAQLPAAGRRSPPRGARRGEAAPAWSGPGSGSARRSGRPPGVRRVPAHRRRGREGDPERRHVRRPTTSAGGRRWPCWTSRRSSPRGRCTACASGCCTAGCPPEEKDAVMRALHRGRDRRAGGDHGDRGRRPRPGAQILFSLPEPGPWVCRTAGTSTAVSTIRPGRCRRSSCSRSPARSAGEGAARWCCPAPIALVDRYREACRAPVGAGKENWLAFMRHHRWLSRLLDGADLPDHGRPLLDRRPRSTACRSQVVELTGPPGDVVISHLHVSHSRAPIPAPPPA